MLSNKKKSVQEEAGDISRNIHERLTEILKNPGSLTPQEESEWRAMIAAAGISGSSLKAAQVIKDAGKLPDNMHEETLKMIERAHKKLPKNPRPSIDTQKLIDASERLQKMIERENEEREKRLKQLAEASDKLKAGVDSLINGIEKTESDWRKQGCPVTRPVTVRRPLKLKKPAP